MNIFLSINFNLSLGTQKNRLNETVLLSTHNICFGWAITYKVLYVYYRQRDWGINPNFRNIPHPLTLRRKGYIFIKIEVNSKI